MKIDPEKRVELETRIARGLARLRQYAPDWYKQVKVKTFDFKSTCACVLGQLGQAKQPDGWLDHYTIGRRILKLKQRRLADDRSVASRYGFDWDHTDDDEHIAYLGRRWKQIIRQERKAHAHSAANKR